MKKRKASYFVPVALLAPLAVLAALVAVAERLLGDDGTIARLLVAPFLWAVERDGRVRRWTCRVRSTLGSSASR